MILVLRETTQIKILNYLTHLTADNHLKIKKTTTTFENFHTRFITVLVQKIMVMALPTSVLY